MPSQDINAYILEIASLKAELRKVKILANSRAEQLIQSEKLASMGLLAAGVAHEIKNPLGFISNNLEVLEEYIDSYRKVINYIPVLHEALRTSSDGTLQVHADKLKSTWSDNDFDYINTDISQLMRDSLIGSARVNDIVMNLNAFIHVDSNKTPVLCDINEELKRTLLILNHELKYRIQLHTEFASIPKIYMLPGEIHQAFLNLLMNAIHAIENEGDIWVTTQHDSGQIIIRVRDNGSGIKPEHVERICDPFFTTKSKYEGTGLGLAISKDILNNHHGTLSVKSTMGQGSEFTLILPDTVLPKDIAASTTSHL